MKSITTLTAAVVLALSSASMASALTTYHVTGSTAFRVAVVSAEVAIAKNSSGTPFATSFGGKALTSANISVVQDSASSPTIRFENNFTGSIAGLQALTDASTTVAFPTATGSGETPTTVSTTPTPTQAAAGGTSVSASNSSVLDTVKPDISFGDVTQSTSQQIISASTDHSVTTPAGDTVVGVVPFVFVANGSTDVYSRLGGLSIDPQKFTYIWGSVASTTLSFLTGNSADQATTIYPLGRDVDSGTRAAALAETGYGLTGSGVITGVVAQYYPYASSDAASADNDTTGVIGNDSTLSNPTIAALALAPAKVVDGFSEAQGNGGYSSGGNLAIGMSTAFVSGTTNTVLVTYLGVSDATSALTASGTNRQVAKLLAYNGVTFVPNPATVSETSSNSELVEQGTYTYWTFEHLYANSGASSEASAFVTQLSTNKLDELSSAGVNLPILNGAIFRAAGDGSSIQ